MDIQLITITLFIYILYTRVFGLRAAAPYLRPISWYQIDFHRSTWARVDVEINWLLNRWTGKIGSTDVTPGNLYSLDEVDELYKDYLSSACANWHYKITLRTCRSFFGVPNISILHVCLAACLASEPVWQLAPQPTLCWFPRFGALASRALASRRASQFTQRKDCRH